MAAQGDDKRPTNEASSEDFVENAAVPPSADEDSAESEEVQGAVGLDNEVAASSQSVEEEEDVETDPRASIQLGQLNALQKLPFKFKKGENGNILTLHHTLERRKMLLRIHITACCFSPHSTHYVAIDTGGTVFVFDLSNKLYWKQAQINAKASVVVPWAEHGRQYLVGTTVGQLLLLNLDETTISKKLSVASNAIKDISLPGQPLKPQHMALVHIGYEAILVNLDTFTATHRLSFDEVKIELKFASYLPRSEQIFTCFTNDAVHIWSSVTLNAVRVFYPLKARDRKLRTEGSAAISATFDLHTGEELRISCKYEDYSNGMIIAYCCHPDGSLLCLSTLDRYLVLLNLYSFEVQHIVQLRDFILKACVFLPQPRGEVLIMGITNNGHVLLLNCLDKEIKMKIETKQPRFMNISRDGKLLSISNSNGKVNIWSVCRLYNIVASQAQCVKLLKAAFKQSQPLPMDEEQEECLHEDIRRLLNRDRLLGILREYRWFPKKYRTLIWCALLQLPYNRREFQQLLKMGTPLVLKQRAEHIKMKNEILKRAMLRVWSCLAHWCKVFAYCKFMPNLIFPFVKLFPRNALVSFEICATLLLNHFELFFESHPLEPSNYLGMCENVLQRFDEELCKFYAKYHIKPVHYAWPMLSSAFSEVFDEDQWLCLWDNILSWPPYYPVFVCVAYNILQREVIMRLPDKPTIISFFREQNPVDVCRVIAKAYSLMQKCSSALHPKRYIKDFRSIPKNVYPKFVNYPHEWLRKHEEDVAKLQEEQREIDARIRKLELEDMKMRQRLEREMKSEEHAKRMQKMEKRYRETLQREEDRLACQRKMLLLYQKEIRNRKSEMIATIKESKSRKEAIAMETEMDLLLHSIERERLRNDTDLLIAEDEIRNQDLEIYAEKYLNNDHAPPLRFKYYDDIQRLCQERQLLSKQLREIGVPQVKERHSQARLDAIEEKIDEIQREFESITKQKK